MEALSKKEKINLDTAEIAKRIRKKIKKEFPNCKFSVRTERYSGGSSITISLMEADFKVIRDIENISDFAIKDLGTAYDREKVKQSQERDYHQLNQHTLREEFNPDKWNNGLFLTEKAHNVLKRAVEISDYYNYDDSEPRTDYYSVNFSLSVEIGKHDKPFKRIGSG